MPLIRMKRKLTQASLAALLSLLLITSPVLAISNPSSISLESIKVFQNIFTAGDVLFIGEHNIDYDPTEPTETSIDAFQLQLRSTDNLSLIRSKGATYYQWSLTAIYFTPAQVISSNVTWESDYVIRIAGNPAMFGTLTEDVNVDTKSLSPTDWNADGIHTSKELLRLYLIDVAQRMETDSGITYLITASSGEKVLNSAGRTIFLAAIPILDSIIPGLFQLSSGNINLAPSSVNASYETATAINTKLGTTIGSAFTGIGTWFGITQGQAAGAWILIFILTVASIVFLSTNNTTGAMILIVPIVVMGAYIGAIPLTLLFTAGLILVMYTGYFFWLRGT